MEKTPSFFSRPEVRSYGVPILILLVGLLLIPLVTIPTWNNTQKTIEQISQERERIIVLRAKASQLLDFSGQSELINKQFDLLNTAVTSESKIPELLTKVQSLSDSCGVEVTALQFGGETTQQQGKVREVRIQYSGEGSFSQLSCLTNAFELSSRLIDVESLRYSSSEDDFGNLVLSPQATLISYYTPEISLDPDRKITFSFSDAIYLQSVEILKTLIK
jgi:Tfp pilus assembly protein PilO